MVSLDRIPWWHPLRYHPIYEMMCEEEADLRRRIEAELRRAHKKLCPRFHWLIAEHSCFCLNCLEPVRESIIEEDVVLCPECGMPMLPELDDPERYYCEDCGREWTLAELEEDE